MVLYESEKSGEHFYNRCAEDFKDTLKRYGLMDLPLVSGSWTWSNQRANLPCSKIDKFVVIVDCQSIAMNLC